MKIKFLFCLLLLLAITSCSTQKHTSGNSMQMSSNSEADGSSYEKAIVIKEKTETAGVHAEYAWIKEHYPGYQMVNQSLMNKDKKPYDVINIKTSSGQAKAIYFDISNFFGKF